MIWITSCTNIFNIISLYPPHKNIKLSGKHYFCPGMIGCFQNFKLTTFEYFCPRSSLWLTNLRIIDTDFNDDEDRVFQNNVSMNMDWRTWIYLTDHLIISSFSLVLENKVFLTSFSFFEFMRTRFSFIISTLYILNTSTRWSIPFQ